MYFRGMDTAAPLPICIVQAELAWEAPQANHEHLAALIAKGHQDPSGGVIILPEMFSTGFSMNAPQLAEQGYGPSLEWMEKLARARHALVIGSLIVKEGSSYYNRCYAMQPDGHYSHYDKRHPFRMAGEDKVYTPGGVNVAVEWQGWRIGLQVCYDLRFPVWSRNRVQAGVFAYDALVYVANWPEPRSHHWRRLLAARAIENQCYVLACNRVGQDGKGIPYVGDSMIVDQHGEAVARMHRGEGLLHATLDKEQLAAYREKYAFWQDADSFDVKGLPGG